MHKLKKRGAVKLTRARCCVQCPVHRSTTKSGAGNGQTQHGPRVAHKYSLKASVGGAASTDATHPEVVSSVATVPAHHVQK